MGATAAAAAPTLLAYNLSPSPTFLNQALALGLWAAFVLACQPRNPGRGGALLWAALALVGVGVLGSWGPGALPASLALSALGLLLAAAIIAAAGSAARRSDDASGLFAAFATGWVIAGLLNVAVGLLQVFAPGLADGDWLATSSLPGRAVGNLRQPNHLSSLLLWSIIATVALVELGHLSRRAAAVLMALFVFGVVLTASRTGVVSVVLLAVWGALDRRLSPRSRLLLLAAPLLYALAWFGMAQWAALSKSTFGGTERLAEVADTSSRFAIWRETLALWRGSPWLGVGFGEFNIAWTLTPFPGRSTAFFDHTHNLPLHLLVELGLPLGGAAMLLLLAALGLAAWKAWTAPAPEPGGIGARTSVMMVLMIGLHSQLEYPLWYAYFLLPAAWAWGYALGGPLARGSRRAQGASSRVAGVSSSDRAARVGARSGARSEAVSEAGSDVSAGSVDKGRDKPGHAASLPLNLGAAAIVLGAALAVVDYTRVVAIFNSADGDVPLAQRIEAGRRSVLFSHHADYAAVTSGVALRDARASFANTTHYLLDSRLMLVWAEWLAANGEPDLARHLAARLREFRSADADEFFSACPKQAVPAADAGQLPFQCQLPQRTPHWREYLRR